MGELVPGLCPTSTGLSPSHPVPRQLLAYAQVALIKLKPTFDTSPDVAMDTEVKTALETMTTVAIEGRRRMVTQ